MTAPWKTTIRSTSQQGALYGHWQRQREHAARLAAAEAYPRPGRSRTLLPIRPAAE
ncbi:hypothetical protein [Dactylosporangium sp. NPDC049140]|uniref:hypothetical protein n=1 Tax=Dactylosporangium sp. NPDC049140 TaxID=3155647 RepID=UPI0033D7584E